MHPDYTNDSNEVLDPISLDFAKLEVPLALYVLDDPGPFGKAVFCEFRMIEGGRLAPTTDVAVEPI